MSRKKTSEQDLTVKVMSREYRKLREDAPRILVQKWGADQIQPILTQDLVQLLGVRPIDQNAIIEIAYGSPAAGRSVVEAVKGKSLRISLRLFITPLHGRTDDQQ